MQILIEPVRNPAVSQLGTQIGTTPRALWQFLRKTAQPADCAPHLMNIVERLPSRETSENPSEAQYKYDGVQASPGPWPRGPGLNRPSLLPLGLPPNRSPVYPKKDVFSPASSHSQNLSLKLWPGPRPPRVGDFRRQCGRAARGRGWRDLEALAHLLSLWNLTLLGGIG